MKALDEFLATKIHRHPTTWLLAIGAAVYGGLQMYSIREAKRAAGQEIQLGSLTVERIVDFLMGAFFQLLYLYCSIWMVAGFLEEKSAWLRQGAVLAVYLLVNLLTKFI